MLQTVFWCRNHKPNIDKKLLRFQNFGLVPGLQKRRFLSFSPHNNASIERHSIYVNHINKLSTLNIVLLQKYLAKQLCTYSTYRRSDSSPNKDLQILILHPRRVSALPGPTRLGHGGHVCGRPKKTSQKGKREKGKRRGLYNFSPY